MSSKHSKPPQKSSSSRKHQPPATEQRTPTQVSFLFSVNELHLNEDPYQGGIPPRYNEHRGWLPPLRKQGFFRSVGTELYKWRGGDITEDDTCSLYEGTWWSASGNQLASYRSNTVFYCDSFTNFVTTNGDASLRDVETGQEPEDSQWWPLSFQHDRGLSRVDYVNEQYLASNGGNWIRALGLGSYRPRRGAADEGLSGNLAMIIALMAFTCEAGQLYDVLIRDRAWRRYRWRPQARQNGDGRIDGRGVVVTIYYDPQNTQGSNDDTLGDLQWRQRALVT